jgi:hypothetical protein
VRWQAAPGERSPAEKFLVLFAGAVVGVFLAWTLRLPDWLAVLVVYGVVLGVWELWKAVRPEPAPEPGPTSFWDRIRPPTAD